MDKPNFYPRTGATISLLPLQSHFLYRNSSIFLHLFLVCQEINIYLFNPYSIPSWHNRVYYLNNKTCRRLAYSSNEKYVLRPSLSQNSRSHLPLLVLDKTDSYWSLYSLSSSAMAWSRIHSLQRLSEWSLIVFGPHGKYNADLHGMNNYS